MKVTKIKPPETFHPITLTIETHRAFGVMSANFYRFTVWTEGKKVADNLGLVPDSNSHPELFEWYYTFDNQKDSIAFQDLLCGYPNDSNNVERWVAHSVSVWQQDPRL